MQIVNNIHCVKVFPKKNEIKSNNSIVFQLLQEKLVRGQFD